MSLIARKIGNKEQPLKEHLEEVRKNIIKIFTPYSPNLKEALRLAGLLHDIGKVEKSIQECLKNNKKPLLSHAGLSFVFFRYFCKKKFNKDIFDDEKLALIAFAILSHHSIPHQNLESNIASSLMNKVKKLQFDDEILQLLLKEFELLTDLEEIKRELKDWIEDPCLSRFIRSSTSNRRFFTQVYNALVKADWSSATKEEIENKSVSNELKNLINSSIKVNKSNIHKWVYEITQASENLLLEFPTGFGKTYIGVAYGLKSNKKRVIYTLPVTTIIEDVYERLCKVFGEASVGWYTSRYLPLQVDEEEINYNEYLEAKYFNKPLIVTTLDQVLMAWLNIGRYPLKEWAFYDSFLILDEPQLYSPFMLFLFSKLFPEYQDILNLTVMSATVPRFLKEELKDCVKEPFLSETTRLFENYKRTYFDLSYFDIPFLEGDDKEINPKIKEIIRKFLDARKNVAIVVNTVLRAQKIFDALPFKNKFLFHARFILRDKRNKLKDLKEFLKKKRPTVVVATQIIEAGINLDFDVMLREIAPLDSLIQSAGRVNREGKHTEPLAIFILKSNDYSPYEKYQIEITKNILNSKDFSILPNYTELLYYEKLLEYWRKMDDWIIKDEKEAERILNFRNKINPFAIKLSEENIQLRKGYFSLSVIPEKFLNEILELLKKYKNTNDVWKRLKISAKIQSYMVEVPIFAKVTKNGVFREYICPLKDYPWINVLYLPYCSIKGIIPKEDYII